MSTLLTKIHKLASGLKSACLEHLWLIGILIPIAVLVVLGIVRSGNFSHDQTQIEQEHQYVVSQVQVSSTELAKIVSLSLSELLNIDIYFEVGSSLLRGDPVMMSMGSLVKEEFSVHSQYVMLLNRHRRNRADMLICNLYCNSNNNPSIAELA